MNRENKLKLISDYLDKNWPNWEITLKGCPCRKCEHDTRLWNIPIAAANDILKLIETEI